MPLTSPVLVVTKISAASQRWKLTSPVLFLTVILPDAMKSSKTDLPVLPMELKSAQVTFWRQREPVDRFAIKVPSQAISEHFMDPVVAEREMVAALTCTK